MRGGISSIEDQFSMTTSEVKRKDMMELFGFRMQQSGKAEMHLLSRDEVIDPDLNRCEELHTSHIHSGICANLGEKETSLFSSGAQFGENDRSGVGYLQAGIYTRHHFIIQPRISYGFVLEQFH